MSRDNPGWGAPCIHGELLKPGIHIAETSVTLRRFILCLALAGGIGILIMVASGLGVGFAHRSFEQQLGIGIDSTTLKHGNHERNPYRSL